jgi:hypothetical protein
MKYSRPEQALLTSDNDLDKTEETLATIAPPPGGPAGGLGGGHLQTLGVGRD